MKSFYLAVAALIITVTTFAQKVDDQLTRVRRINGVEAYILCEPLRDYTVLVEVGSGLKAESMLTGGLVNKSISDRVEQFIRRVTKENGKVDAVIYSSGKRIVGVTFKDDATPATKGIGRVSKIAGYPVFVMSEPINNYTVINSKGGGVKWKSLVTGGLVNNSIEEDVEQMVKKLQARSADAVILDGGKEASAIMFSNK